jgi:diguanylate cyclase (GGDEF)-like protein
VARNEQAWRRSSEEQLRLLRDFTAQLVEAESTDEVLHVIARATHQVLDGECFIFLNSGGGRLAQRAYFGPHSPEDATVVDPIELLFGTGIVGAAAAAGEAQLVPNTSLDPRYISGGRPRLSELAVPIVAKGSVIGVIDLEHPDAGFYTADHLHFVEDIAAISAVRVKAAMTLEHVEHERKAMEILAQTDDLTGLGNRRKFEARMAEAMQVGQNFSVAILDLDRFKLVNDRLGHHQGDVVICQLGSILEKYAHEEGTMIARLGGDEFGLLRVGPGHEDLDNQVSAVVKAVRSTAWATSGAIIDLAVSAGVASGSNEDVWEQADDALLVAKSEGGDQFVRMDPDAPKALALQDDRQWAEKISQALAQDEFFLLAQPIIPTNTPDRRCDYYELLLRYRADDGTIRTPRHFLDSAARYGMLERIDGWVIRHAIEWLGATPDVSCSINVTPGSMISGFVIERTRKALEDYGVDPSRLILEVTEHAAIADPSAFRSAVRAARGLGIRVAMDDLGSGWTSLAVIRDNPIDIVKIDGAWVSETTLDAVAETAVRSIVECAHLLGAEVVAEWVEDRPTLDLMREMGVEYAQGFLFGRPLTLPELDATLDQKAA